MVRQVVMSVPDSSRTRCKHLDAVSRFAENYRANGTCDACGEAGAWAPISATSEGAIELAEMALGIHHSLVHGNSSRPPNSRKPVNSLPNCCHDERFGALSTRGSLDRDFASKFATVVLSYHCHGITSPRK
jgi:hypothetical protein